ncbi:MAG: 8-oxo-dGTP diphosphatase [Nocardioidaceae bacterium]|nr:8-oxo-dGTP diphosphatase [Nocardioidaceae bacterium]
MTGRFVVVPAAYVFMLRPAPMPGGREVLLQLRQGTGYMDGYWAAAVAGHVERGESVYEAARREAREEVGIEDVELVPWCAMQRTGVGDDPLDERVDYFFLSTSWAGTPELLEPEKAADLRWFDLDTLPTPVVPHERRVLESVRAGSTAPIVVHGF